MTIYRGMYHPQGTSTNNEHLGHLENFSRKPPKPPCWRDFISGGDSPVTKTAGHKSSKSDSSNRVKALRKIPQIYFTDLSTIHKSTSDPSASGKATTQDEASHAVTPSQPVQATRQRKKGWRSKLRRTQSQSAINNKDLPNLENLTISLAETESEEFGLKRNLPFDPRLYMDRNVKRCEQWVQSVRDAQEPLSLTDLDFDQGSGEELEIPEETWHDFREVKQEKSLQRSKPSGVHCSLSLQCPDRTLSE